MALPEDNMEFTRQFLGISPLDKAIEWITGNMSPEQVFNENQLRWWAEENGYTKEAKNEK